MLFFKVWGVNGCFGGDSSYFSLGRVIYKVFLSLIVVILFCGCQSKLEVAGNEHKSVSDKWQALSAYAESEVVNYGVTVTARLKVVRKGNIETFTLEGIKFSPYANEQELDLLTPSFEQKYICLPECYQLLEYVTFDGRTSGTMLAHFYEQHEFELFQFYGDLVVLSDNLKNIAESSDAILGAYLQFLAEIGTEYDSTKSFIQFLEVALSENSFQEFIDNPDVASSPFLKRYNVSADIQWNSTFKSDGLEVSPEQQLFNITSILPDQQWTTEQILPEQQWAEGELLVPEQQWSEADLLTADAKWIAADVEPPELVLFSSDNNNVTLYTWHEAKMLPIVVGENACSFKENLFGVVTDITNTIVKVKLLGQAKKLSEGIIQDLPSGSMFAATNNLFFLPRIDNVAFDKAEIAACYIE